MLLLREFLARASNNPYPTHTRNATHSAATHDNGPTRAYIYLISVLIN